MSESIKQSFNHLKIHSQYSICEGAVKIDELQSFSKSNKFMVPRIGLADALIISLKKGNVKGNNLD